MSTIIIKTNHPINGGFLPAKKRLPAPHFLLLLLLLACAAATRVDRSLAAPIAAASASVQQQVAQNRWAAPGLLQRQQSINAPATAQATAAASATAADLANNDDDDEADELLASLLELEAQPSGSLDDCALWYNLNLRHRELAAATSGGRQQLQQARPGAVAKEAECDALEQVVAATRDRVANFKRLLKNENKEVEFVGELANEYLELMNAAPGNEQLARELNDLRAAGGKARLTLEELEQLLDFVGTSLAAASSDDNDSDHNLQPEASSLAVASTGMSDAGRQPQVQVGGDELSELDNALRRLIERELELTADELGQLAELGGLLERRLADGLVDLSSGRFRALSGTLDAVRTVVMHRLAADEEEAAAAAAAAARQERERALAAEQEAAELAARSRRYSVRDRMGSLLTQVGARVARRQSPPVMSSAAASSSAVAGALGGHASASAIANNNNNHIYAPPAVAPPVAPTAPLVAAPMPPMPPASAAAMASATASSSARRSHLQPDRSSLIGDMRLQKQQQQRRFADQLAQQRQQ